MKRTNTGTAKNPINLSPDTAPRRKRVRSKVPENVVDLEAGERIAPKPTAPILDSATSPKSYEATLHSSTENKLIEKLEKLNLNVEQAPLKRAASRSPPQDSETRPPIKRAAPTKVLPESMQPRIADASSSGSEEPSSSSPHSSSQREPVPPRNQAVPKRQAPPVKPSKELPKSNALTRRKRQAPPEKPAEEVPMPLALTRGKREQSIKPVNYVQDPISSSEKETSNSSDENNSYYSSSRSSSSRSSLPGNREQNVQVDIKYDINELKLLNALDSYHDFTGQRAKYVNNFIKHRLVKEVINSFLEDEKSKAMFNEIINTGGFEKKMYEKYVADNRNIIKIVELPLNKIIESTGGAGENKKLKVDKKIKKDEDIDVFSDILKHYKIPEKEASKLAIILDGGSFGCRKKFKNNYVESYASWFDRGNGKSDNSKRCNKNYKNFELNEKIAVSKINNDLFYINEISGKYNKTGEKDGYIKLNNEKISFSSPDQSGCKPAVEKYSDYINIIQKDKNIVIKGEPWFTEQINKIYAYSEKDIKKAVNDSCMFLMDLKRAGDGMQIQSVKVMETETTKIPIFVTQDIMAATISAFKGFRTILTTIDKKRNTTSSKYALLLAEYTKLDEKKQGGDSQDAHTPLKYRSANIAEIKNCISDYRKTITSNIMKEYLQYVINLTDKYKSPLFDDLCSNICQIIKLQTLTSSQKNISIANYINNIFENNNDEEEMDYFIKSPVGAIYMEYLLNTSDIRTLYNDIRNLKSLKYLTRSDIEQMIGKTNKIHPIILNFLNDIKNPNILINNLQILKNNIPPGSHLTPFGPILENQQHPRTVLKDLYNRTLKDHVTYMNTIIPIKPGSSVSGRTKSSSLKTNSYTDYTYNPTNTDLYNFMKLPFQVKHMIIQYSKDKEKIIKHVFDTFYKSDDFKSDDIKKEIAVIKHCKKILKVHLEKTIESSDNAFLLFREILYFQPEYIDPFMLIYMTYSNSPVPPNIAFQSIPITPQTSPVPVAKAAPNIPRPTASRKLLLAGGKKK